MIAIGQMASRFFRVFPMRMTIGQSNWPRQRSESLAKESPPALALTNDAQTGSYARS